MDRLDYMQNMLKLILENNETMQLACFIGQLIAGAFLLINIITLVQYFLSNVFETHSYYRNIKQIMRRFEMQGILGIEITYHEGEFYITYLDIEICKRDLLNGLLFLEELLYYKDLFQPPKHIKAGIKFHWFINDIKEKIGLNKRPKI